MEPFSALSAAAAVVQFVDFGSRILSDSCEVYSSATGQASRYVELSAISSDLAALASEIESISAKIPPATEGSAVEMLKELCGECRQANSEADKLLAKLQASGVSKFDLDKDNFLVSRDRIILDIKPGKFSSNFEHARNSFMVAIKGTMKDSRLKELRKRMGRIRTQITTALLVCIW
jgi:hypothetical protein